MSNSATQSAKPVQQKSATPSQPVSAGASPAAVQLKQALVGLDFEAQSQMLAPPVQARGDVQARGADAVHAHAEKGTQGAGGALPHLAQIQKSFGSHDVSGVKAHTGGDANKACEGMGAEAFATGNSVAFKGGPDLHTAAHEAAHVVQQRGGVSLSGGVGKSGDSYEQNADKVADAVVAGKPAEHLLGGSAGGGGSGVQQSVQRKAADPDKGISDGKVTLADHNGGEVGSVAKGKAGLEQTKENSSTLVEQAKSISTQTARSEKDMLAAIASGGTPRFVARVDEKANFVSRGTFGNPGREFVFATEPADLRGCKPGAALIKVGWTKAWLAGKIGKEIGVCILDTSKAVPDATGDKKMTVGRMEWPDIIAKAMGDAKFKREAMTAGVKDDAELQQIFDVLKATPVKATPRWKDPDVAGKVRKLLDSNYGANELYTGMGATMNTEGGLGAREVMVMNNGTGLKLTPQNHVVESLGTLTQAEYDSMPG